MWDRSIASAQVQDRADDPQRPWSDRRPLPVLAVFLPGGPLAATGEMVRIRSGSASRVSGEGMR